MYGGRSPSRRHASPDRVCCRNGEVERRGMHSIRHPFLLAVSPLHGNCLDVPRGLLEGGYLVLPWGRQSGRIMSWQSLAPSLVLIPVSVSPIFIHGFGRGYSVVAFALSSALCFYSARLALRKSNGAARRLLMASIVYLPLVFFLVMLECFP